MKKLKVFKDFEKDIFFEPIRLNRLKRIHVEDRYRCLIWELARTRFLTEKRFQKMVITRRKFAEYENWFRQKANRSEKNRQRYLELYDQDIDGRFTIGFCGGVNYFPYECPNFPYECFIDQDTKERDSWDHGSGFLKFRNPCEDSPMTICHNIEDLEGIDEKFLMVSTMSPRNQNEKDIQERIVTSTKVPVKLHIDPCLTIQQLQHSLIENIEQIHEIAQQQKQEFEKDGWKFSPPSDIDAKRVVRSFQAKLSYLGYYRLLECEKWDWSEVNDLFLNKFQSDEASRVTIKSFEHYKYNVTKYLPGLNHSSVI